MITPTHWEIRATSSDRVQWWAIEAAAPIAAIRRAQSFLPSLEIEATGTSFAGPPGHALLHEK